MIETQPLTSAERSILLKLARQSVERVVNQEPLPALKLDDYSAPLRENGASFVTLTEDGDLRGCIGALEPYQPLVQDVCEHAAGAAVDDYRFQPVSPREVSHLQIEISRLTPPQPFLYTAPEELLTRLRPHIDGVIIKDGIHRATFLPQVWEKLPDPRDFLAHLCDKMGAPFNLWQIKPLKVFTYQVEEFHE
jgi:AmmeMemoRadiSam system protein A